MKNLLALALIAVAPAFAGTTYQPVSVGAPCMIKPLGTERVINANFISSVELRPSVDISFPLGPLSVFWPKETPYYAVFITGPNMYMEIRVKDPVEGVNVVHDTLEKIKACQK